VLRSALVVRGTAANHLVQEVDELLIAGQVNVLHLRSEVVADVFERHINDEAIVPIAKSWQRRQQRELLAVLIGMLLGPVSCLEVSVRKQHRSQQEHFLHHHCRGHRHRKVAWQRCQSVVRGDWLPQASVLVEPRRIDGVIRVARRLLGHLDGGRHLGPDLIHYSRGAASSSLTSRPSLEWITCFAATVLRAGSSSICGLLVTRVHCCIEVVRRDLCLVCVEGLGHESQSV